MRPHPRTRGEAAVREEFEIGRILHLKSESMNKTPIEWVDYSANPLRYRDKAGNIVHACVHKSAGCNHCYAEALAPRYGRAGKPFTAENMKHLTPFLDEKELHRMLTYKPAGGKRCFVGDMTDVFGEWVPFELLDQLFAVFALRPDVAWHVLTKRTERMQEYFSQGRRSEWSYWIGRYCDESFAERVGRAFDRQTAIAVENNFPLKNVWLGVSVEDRKN